MIEAKRLQHVLTESVGNLPMTKIRVGAVDALAVSSVTRPGRSIAYGREMR